MLVSALPREATHETNERVPFGHLLLRTDTCPLLSFAVRVNGGVRALHRTQNACQTTPAFRL